MFHFMGIQFGNCDYKLQQIVQDTDGKPVQKTSDILFWVVADIGDGVLYIIIYNIKPPAVCLQAAVSLPMTGFVKRFLRFSKRLLQLREQFFRSSKWF